MNDENDQLYEIYPCATLSSAISSQLVYENVLSAPNTVTLDPVQISSFPNQFATNSETINTQSPTLEMLFGFDSLTTSKDPLQHSSFGANGVKLSV